MIFYIGMMVGFVGGCLYMFGLVKDDLKKPIQHKKKENLNGKNSL